MINLYFLIGMGLFLLVVSIIDLKVRAIPSILLTGALFVTLAVNYGNIMYGTMAFILSYLLYEADFFGGIADIKVFTLLGLLIPSMQSFMIYTLFFAIVGISWKITWKLLYKKDTETPFLPVFFLIFLGLAVGGFL